MEKIIKIFNATIEGLTTLLGLTISWSDAEGSSEIHGRYGDISFDGELENSNPILGFTQNISFGSSIYVSKMTPQELSQLGIDL